MAKPDPEKIFRKCASKDPIARISAIVALSEFSELRNDGRWLRTLEKCLSDSDVRVRKEAAITLRYSSPLALDGLVLALKDESSEVRLEAVISLGSIRAVESIQHLYHSLRFDPDENVRVYAAVSLGQQNHSSATESLLHLLAREVLTPKVRAAVVEALGDTEDLRAIASLRQAMGDPDPEIRLSASYAVKKFSRIGELRDEELSLMGRALTLALEDEDFRVRANACEALAKLKLAASVSSLVGRLDDPHIEVQVEAVRALASIDFPEKTERLLGLLKRPEALIQRAVASSFPFDVREQIPSELSKFFEDPKADEFAKAEFASSLAVRGGEDASEFLGKALNVLRSDADTYALESVLKALALLRGPLPFQRILDLLDSKEEVIRGEATATLAALGSERYFEVIEKLLQDQSSFVRRRAIEGLSLFPPENSKPILIGSLVGSDVDVVESAIQGLGEICDSEELKLILKQLPLGSAIARSGLNELISSRAKGPQSVPQPNRIPRGSVRYE